MRYGWYGYVLVEEESKKTLIMHFVGVFFDKKLKYIIITLLFITFIWYISIMVKKAVSYIHEQTQHKDRLVFVGLIAILAFTIVNTIMLSAEISVANASLILDKAQKLQQK